MRFSLSNEHESPIEIVAEQAGVRRSLAPGQEVVVGWAWSGFADLTFGSGWLSLSTPPGGRIVVADAAVADAEVEFPSASEVSEFWIHNASEEQLSTLWEPWCAGDVPPGGGPMRIEWTPDQRVVEMYYEPGLVVVWDHYGSCRAWQPDGVEVLTGGTRCC